MTKLFPFIPLVFLLFSCEKAQYETLVEQYGKNEPLEEGAPEKFVIDYNNDYYYIKDWNSEPLKINYPNSSYEITVSPSGNYVSFAEGSILKIYNTINGNFEKSIELQEGFLGRSYNWHPNEDKLLFVSTDYTIKEWDINQNTIIDKHNINKNYKFGVSYTWSEDIVFLDKNASFANVLNFKKVISLNSSTLIDYFYFQNQDELFFSDYLFSNTISTNYLYFDGNRDYFIQLPLSTNSVKSTKPTNFSYAMNSIKYRLQYISNGTLNSLYYYDENQKFVRYKKFNPNIQANIKNVYYNYHPSQLEIVYD
jgi:hypothetical protein